MERLVPARGPHHLGAGRRSCAGGPRSTPDRDYLKFADSPWLSYGEVNARANRIANALLARGVERGESVSVMLPNCEEFLPVWYGILKAGAVMSSINTAYKGDFLSLDDQPGRGPDADHRRPATSTGWT